MATESPNERASYHFRTFLLVNLLAFPVAGVIVRALLPIMHSIGMPLWTLIAFAMLVGAGLILINSALVGIVYKISGWTSLTIAMALWTLACIATLFLLGSYSPINVALAIATHVAGIPY